MLYHPAKWLIKSNHRAVYHSSNVYCRFNFQINHQALTRFSLGEKQFREVCTRVLNHTDQGYYSSERIDDHKCVQ